MPQSLANVLIHAVWSTKERFPFLTDKPLREDLHRYLGGISARLDCPTLIVGGVADHVHLLIRLSRKITLADWVKEMKRASTIWMTEQSSPNDARLSDFHWQSGYGIFSVSESKSDDVRRYIADQERHHQQTSFQDEFRRFLAAHQIQWDERYLWD